MAKEKVSRFDLLKMISDGVDLLTPISSMEDEMIVKTLFTSYNRCTGIGGHPLRRMTVIHGPNHSGKSVLGLMIAESMRRAGHVSVIFDTEFAAEKNWYSGLTDGDDVLFKMPESLDELIQNIQTMLNNLEKAKKAKAIPNEAGCCFVVDTLTKLMPADLLEKIRSEGVEKMYPLQAMWLSVWSKSVIPLLYRSNSSLVCILQERDNQSAKPFQKTYKVTGGQSIQYDASIRIRVDFGQKIEENDLITGMQSHYTVEKNKTDGFSQQKGSFFTSNGSGVIPRGFDLIREAIEEAKERGVLTKEKGAYQFGPKDSSFLSISGGMNDVILHLLKNPDDLNKVVGFLNCE